MNRIESVGLNTKREEYIIIIYNQNDSITLLDESRIPINVERRTQLALQHRSQIELSQERAKKQPGRAAGRAHKNTVQFEITLNY